jgi:hypothetical protein
MGAIVCCDSEIRGLVNLKGDVEFSVLAPNGFLGGTCKGMLTTRADRALSARE